MLRPGGAASPARAPADASIAAATSASAPPSRDARLFAEEVITPPECTESLAFRLVVAEPVGVDLARLDIAGEGVDRPLAVSPDAERARLALRGEMPGGGIDLDDAPQAAAAAGAAD